MEGFSLASLLVWYVVFLFSTTFHEFAHSLVAFWGGDRTAYEGGQVTLDPLPHMKREPFGLVIFPLLSFVLSGGQSLFGWASAPVDPAWARKHPGRSAIMSAAGPASNFLLAGIAFVLIRLLTNAGYLEFSFYALGRADGIVVPGGGAPMAGPWGAVAMGLSVLLSLNIILGVFNLIPLPPLDGAHVVEGLSPRTMGKFYGMIRANPGLSFLTFVIVWKVGGFFIWPVLGLVISFL